MAQRRIVHTVLDADANRALLERQDAVERDRERRRREASGISVIWIIRELSADVVVSISRYRFEFQRVLLRIAKRQRFDKLERRRRVHSIVSADEVFSRYFVEEVQQLV
ncbi:hypothetical protein F511_42033 [Dorcoceras hygrometricum]|uniref:Uncharacterized protein n=1 Tax=Dorcoceras hygrometricum TaxID=472368 RepID=A0A2Z7AB62_9LAMI|nr:hypothetical protein F511_42033 [Dorcoceras hygrometricum]